MHDETAASFPKLFDADELFSEGATNKKVFEHVCRPLLNATIGGSEAAGTLCFFAYGHTNSGKTHTIAGTGDDAGLLTRCALHLLRALGTVDVSIVEVYNERVFDLLAHGEERKVRRHAGRGYAGPSVVVDGLRTCTVRSAEEWGLVAAFGLAQRRTGPNEHNSRSSRSHAIFTLKSCGIGVCLVDLAGSERQTAFTKALEKDSITINKSLSRLSTVIEALSRRKTKGGAAEPKATEYVNFRDTMLTVLLQRYLEGTSVTTFIACVHPASTFYPETLSTMRYSARLKHVTTQLSSTATTAGLPLSQRSANEQRELVDELVRLREELRRQHESSTGLQEQQRQRIEELEKQSMLFQRTMSNLSVESAGSTHASSSSLLAAGGRSLRDTRRVTSWLLSRCQASMPTFTVSFDDYFDSVFPTIDVVGYVSTMAMMPPVDFSDPSVARAFLDTGDVAMGLLMLDAGIPPLVHLHKSACHDVESWESPEWGERDVFVLAVFEVDATELDDLQEEDGPSTCCNGVLSCNALVPFAIVFGSRPHAREARSLLLDHLRSLAQHQDTLIVEDSADENRHNDRHAHHDSKPILVAAPGAIKTNLHVTEFDSVASQPAAIAATTANSQKPQFFGSLLHEVLEQARRSASRDELPLSKPRHIHPSSGHEEKTPAGDGHRGDFTFHSSLEEEEEEEEEEEDQATTENDVDAEVASAHRTGEILTQRDGSTFVFDNSGEASRRSEHDEGEAEDGSISFVENEEDLDEHGLQGEDVDQCDHSATAVNYDRTAEATAIAQEVASVTDVSLTANTSAGAIHTETPADPQGGLSVFFVSALTQQGLNPTSAAQSRAASATTSPEGEDADVLRLFRHRPTATDTLPSTAEVMSLPATSPVDSSWKEHHSVPQQRSPFFSVAAVGDVPTRRSPQHDVNDELHIDAASGCRQVQHGSSFLAFKANQSVSPTPAAAAATGAASTTPLARRLAQASSPAQLVSTPPPRHASEIACPCEPFGASCPRDLQTPRACSSPSSAGQTTVSSAPRQVSVQSEGTEAASCVEIPLPAAVAAASAWDEGVNIQPNSKRRREKRRELTGTMVPEGCTPQCQSCSMM